MDEPTDLPEGAEVYLFLADDGDELDDEDRRRLHAALLASQDEVDRGELLDWSTFMADLRAARE